MRAKYHDGKRLNLPKFPGDEAEQPRVSGQREKRQLPRTEAPSRRCDETKRGATLFFFSPLSPKLPATEWIGDMLPFTGINTTF